MATSSHVNSGLFGRPQSATKSSSSAGHSLYLPLDEAITTLPEVLQPNDKHEEDELAMFLSQADQLHKPDSGNANASSILNYVELLLEHKTVTADGDSQLPAITEDIAAEIACNAIEDVDSHHSTLSVLKILQEFSWEAKVAMSVTTFILTFGDFGYNLCADSKVSLNNLPSFVELLLEITYCIVEFDKFPTAYMRSMDPKFNAARTHLIVATYWIIRTVIALSASQITSTPYSSSINVYTNTSSPWSSKLRDICNDLKNLLHQMQEFLENLDNEAYRKIKEVFNQTDHSDNMKVLNALFPAYDDEPQLLYDGFANRRVHLSNLEGIYVLLLISGLEVNHELHIIEMIYTECEQKNPYELVWIPIVDRSLKRTNATESIFQRTKSFMPWYSFDHPSLVRIAAINFFKNEWNFGGEPIIVVLDPQGKVVSKNALPMMLIWGSNAFPFTSLREQTLCEQQSWNLELLFDSNLRIEPKISDWVRDDKYIFLYGGKNIAWIRKLRLNARKVKRILQVPMEMIYVGKTNIDEDLYQLCESLMREELGHCFIDPMMSWYFWRRLESMIHSMIQHRKFNGVLQEIQRLHNYDKSNVEWAILAKGSTILVNGLGEIALTTLEEYPLWKDNAFKRGFGVGFHYHYRNLYRKKIRCERIELPTSPLNVPNNTPKALSCPQCQRKMQHYILFSCDHEYNEDDP